MHVCVAIIDNLETGVDKDNEWCISIFCVSHDHFNGTIWSHLKICCHFDIRQIVHLKLQGQTGGDSLCVNLHGQTLSRWAQCYETVMLKHCSWAFSNMLLCGCYGVFVKKKKKTIHNLYTTLDIKVLTCCCVFAMFLCFVVARVLLCNMFKKKLLRFRFWVSFLHVAMLLLWCFMLLLCSYCAIVYQHVFKKAFKTPCVLTCCYGVAVQMH